MKKIIVTAALVALVAEFATATVEFKTKRALEADNQRLESVETVPTPTVSSSTVRAAQPPEYSAMSLVANEAAESARLEKRLAQLKARPPRVVDAQMRAPRAVGRDTPLDAMQTITAALRDGDMATLEHLVSFRDDTKENREAFMANFSEAVRVRYQTPERLMIFSVFDEVLRDPPVAQQVLETHSYSGSGGDEVVTTWTRLASGLERKDYNPFTKTSDGWVFPPFPLAGKKVPVEALRARFDPVTGDVIPRKR